ncbi:MAG: hypothetical protein MI807_10530, partial [Verrucomicrobiales bacterium]|nr:hypothetical protein [Verrucomicrobiales bacterium]
IQKNIYTYIKLKQLCLILKSIRFRFEIYIIEILPNICETRPIFCEKMPNVAKNKQKDSNSKTQSFCRFFGQFHSFFGRVL